MEWKFENINEMKQFAGSLSKHLQLQGEDAIANEISYFERSSYTTSSEYLGEFRIILRKVLSSGILIPADEFYQPVDHAIKAIDKAFSPRKK